MSSAWTAPAGRLMTDEHGASSDGGRRREVVPQAEAGRAADLAVATHVILGVHDPAQVTQERSSDRPGSHA